MSKHVLYMLHLLGLTACLALILSTGSHLQFYTLSLLSSTKASIYDSAYSYFLVKFQTFSQWTSAIFEWHIILPSLLSAAFCMGNKLPRDLAWKAILSLSITISLTDVIIGLNYSPVSIRWIAENIFSNILGSIAISLLLVSIFSIIDFFHTNLPAGVPARRLIAVICLPLGGLIYSGAVYFACEILYNPLPSKFDITVAAPASGAISPHALTADKTANVATKEFSLSPTKFIESNVGWSTPTWNMKINLHNEENSPLKLNIHIVTGCSGPDKIVKQPWPAAWISYAKITDFEVAIDEGPTDFMTMLPTDQYAAINLKAGPTTSFQFFEESIHGKMKLIKIADQNSLLSYSTQRSLQFFIGLPLILENEREIKLSPRKFILKINGYYQTIRFQPPSSILDTTDSWDCRFLNINQLADLKNDEILDISTAESAVGIVITFEHSVTPEYLPNKNVTIAVNSPSGRIEVHDLSAKDLAHEPLGKVQMMQIRGNIAEFSLDGVAQTSKITGALTAEGDISAEFNQSHLRFFGEAYHLWRDQDRLNSTKWEKLSWEPRLFILGLMFSVIAFLYRIAHSCLSRNHYFRWTN
jgi:hypothetical protein